MSMSSAPEKQYCVNSIVDYLRIFEAQVVASLSLTGVLGQTRTSSEASPASSLIFREILAVLYYSQLKAMRAFRQLSIWQTTQPQPQRGLKAMAQAQACHTRTLGSGSGMIMMDEAVEEAEAGVKIEEEVVERGLGRRTRVASTRRVRWAEMNGSMLSKSLQLAQLTKEVEVI